MALGLRTTVLQPPARTALASFEKGGERAGKKKPASGLLNTLAGIGT
jgi:hypothetical protein